MKAGKVLGLIVGGLVTLAAMLLISVRLLVDPNAYKPIIDAAVKQATGRELLLQGDIHLSVLPWIALQVGPGALRNAPGFGEQPLLTFKRAALRARLLPLFARRLEIGRVEIDGLDARLARNADGRGNWERVATIEGASAETATAPAHAMPLARAAQTAGPVAADAAEVFAGIGAIKITNARVSYGPYTVEHLNIETGAFLEGTPAPVTVTFDANRGIATEQASVEARLAFSADFGARRYRAAALTFHGTVNLVGRPRPVRWTFATPALDLDLGAQTLSAPALTLDVAGAHFSGSLAGTQIVDAVHLSGRVALAPLLVREFLPRFGMTAPRTRDPRALSSVAASVAYGYDGNVARLDDLDLTLDATQVKGSASLVEQTTPAVKFALTADTIDLDRYLPPTGGAGVAGAYERAGRDGREGVNERAGAGGAGTDASASGVTPAAWDVNGSLTVGSVHVAPLELTAVAVTVAATGGVIHLFPLQAQVDGGQYSGNIVLDRRGPVPLLTLDEHLTGVEVGRLVSTRPKSVHLSGRGTVTLQATGRGTDAVALLDSLNGHFDAVVKQGALEGVDVGFQLERAEALIGHKEVANPQDTHRTPFDALTLSASLADGVARTRDLTLSSPVLKVTGEGSVNLPTQAVDFSLRADTLRKAGDTPLQIPLKVTGSATDPTVRPDLDALARGPLRQKVRDLLRDKLKGLFNR